MNMHTTFTVTARIRKITDSKDSIQMSQNDRELNINMDQNLASLFAYKFTPNTFSIDSRYKVVIHIKEYDQGIDVILLIDTQEQEKYLIVNKEQFISEVIEGLSRIRLFNTINLLFEYGVPVTDDDIEEEE